MSSLFRRRFRRTALVEPMPSAWIPLADSRTEALRRGLSCINCHRDGQPCEHVAADGVEAVPLEQRVAVLAAQREKAIRLARFVQRFGTEMEAGLAHRFLLALGEESGPEADRRDDTAEEAL